MIHRARPAFLSTMISLMLLGGCSKTDRVVRCRADADCATGEACFADICVGRADKDSPRWAIEISPPLESPLASREYPPFQFKGPADVLQADTRRTMKGTIKRGAPGPTPDGPGNVHIVVSWPSAISGKNDNQVEADGAIKTAGGPIEFNVGIPEHVLGREVTVRLLPSPPLDQVIPPWVLAVTSSEDAQMDLPDASALITIKGVLKTALLDAAMNYSVRAIGDAQVISNSAITDANGRFAIKIPLRLAGDPALAGVSIELSPREASAALPSLLVEDLSAAKPDLSDIVLPPFGQAVMFTVPVVGGTAAMPVSGATVRFRTAVAGATNASAVYSREAQTGADGRAMIALLPGPGNGTQDYSVAVIPPPGSPYAARCLPTFAIANTGGVTASVPLPSKVELSGRVSRPDRQPAAGVQLTALPDNTGNLDWQACGQAPAQPTSTLTGIDGLYQLLLAPGKYKIEYLPPGGSPMPYSVRKAVLKLDGRTADDVTLPTGILAEGSVMSPAGKPVPDCDVSVLGLVPNARPEFGGRARTSSDGRFQIMLPIKD